jgi:PEGA domain
MKKIVPRLLVVWVLLLVSPGLLHAQATLSPAAKREAVRLDREAYKAWQKGNIKGALGFWLKAYSKWAKPLLLYNVALAYEQLKDPVNAVSYLRDYLRVAPSHGGKATIIAQARGRLKKLGQKVSILVVKGPQGAMVLIDDKRIGVVPVEVVIAPGPHRIVLVKAKVKIGSQSVELKAGQSETVTVLAPIPISPPPRKRRVGPGVTGVTGVRSPPPPPPKGIPMTYCIATGVVAVAVALVATGTGIKALQLNKNFQDTGSASARSDGMVLQDATNGLWGAAAAVAVTSAILAVFTRWKRARPNRDTSIEMDLGVTPSGASVSLSGRF